MLTPAFSELQAPSKFPELSMECKQSHFKIKMTQWENPGTSGTLRRTSLRLRAASDRRFPHRQNHSWRANGRNWSPYGPVTFCLQRNFIEVSWLRLLITNIQHYCMYSFYYLFMKWRYISKKLGNIWQGGGDLLLFTFRSSYLEETASIVYSFWVYIKGGLIK